MNFPTFENWLSRRIALKSRLKKVCLCLVTYLMIEARKHSLEGVAGFWGMSTSQFSRFLSTHSIIAVYTLDDLSKRQAKQFSKVLEWLEKGSLPWKIAILIDSTIQHRSGLHTDNAKRFNHGAMLGTFSTFKLYITAAACKGPPMPRQSRIDAPGALHHIIARGIGRRKIFDNDLDRDDFLERLGTDITESQTACFAWALIPNHLLVRTGQTPMATVMRRLLTGYAIGYNRRHWRWGHLFQNRYKSILCQEEPYFLE